MTPGKDLSAIIESILFVYGEPMEPARLARITGADEESVREALGRLKDALRGGGLVLMEHDGAWQMGTHPDMSPYVEALARGQFGEALSRAALETLAVVAYRGPLSRPDIEYIRGVNSSFTLRNLMIRGLVERAEYAKDGRGYRYRVSTDFLKYLGLEGIGDLPRYEELTAMLAGDDASSAASGAEDDSAPPEQNDDDNTDR
jgi:segregation and condensation protein B